VWDSYIIVHWHNCLYRFTILYVLITTCFVLISHHVCTILTFTHLCLLALPTLAIVYTMGVLVWVQQFHTTTCRSTTLHRRSGSRNKNNTLHSHRPVEHSQNTNTRPQRKTAQTSARTQNSSCIGEHHQNIFCKMRCKRHETIVHLLIF
jgi:hypothetical protein